MRKKKMYLTIALAVTLLASVTLSKVNKVSAQTNEPVGIVAAYDPGHSITIIDQSGVQHEYMLSTTLKIIPPKRADSLAIGSFVTVIAPASLSVGKQTAVGIVVHPQIPPGWTVSVFSPTVVASMTITTTTGSETATVTSTPLPGSETATFTETPVVIEIATNTETPTTTPVVLPTDTPTPTATPLGGTNLTDNAFIEWLRSIIRQVLNGQ